MPFSFKREKYNSHRPQGRTELVCALVSLGCDRGIILRETNQPSCILTSTGENKKQLHLCSFIEVSVYLNCFTISIF
jgi:hypothetical protein